MKRKIALPVFLLAAVLCGVWSLAEAEQPRAASLREQLVDALDSADAIYFDPASLDSNQPEGPITEEKYVNEIRALLRQIEPADDVEWPAEEEQYLFSKASFLLLSGPAEDLTTADSTAKTPRCYILNDRDRDRTLLFVHNGSQSYENKDYQLVGMLPFTGLDYTIAMDQRLQSCVGSNGSEYENLMLTVEGDGWSARLQTGEAQPSGDGHSDVPYALFGGFGAAPGFLLEAGRINCDATTAELCSFSLRRLDDVLGYPRLQL